MLNTEKLNSVLPIDSEIGEPPLSSVLEIFNNRSRLKVQFTESI
jgi:hypothetical protein